METFYAVNDMGETDWFKSYYVVWKPEERSSNVTV